MFSRHIKLRPLEKTSAWRKVAIGTWRSVKDPSIYGWIDIDATGILAVMEQHKAKGLKLTPTAIMAKACAVALNHYPILNAVLRFGRIYLRDSIDVFLQVVSGDDGQNLTGMVIRGCDKKSLEEISKEIGEKAKGIKERGEDPFEKSKGTMKILPGFLVGPILDMLSFVLYGLNIFSPLFGAPRDGFGSLMVTSVGMLGIDHAFAPLVMYSKCPIVVTLGKISDQAVVVDGKVVVRPMMPIHATMDHRLIDGLGASKLLKVIKEYLQNPT